MIEKRYRVGKKAYLILFCTIALLCFMFPYTGDDWAWGSSIGIERLENWFDNYSGRYFGNLIVLVLTRSNILKTITMAFGLTGIVFLLNQLSEKSKIGFYLVLINLLLMPVLLLRQAIVWTSGFANYSTSIFLTLIYIFFVRGIYEENSIKYSPKSILPVFFLGVANTLIVEHLTIYNVVLGIYVLVVAYVRHRKIYVQHVAYSLGTILGTVYMFSNSVYRSVATGQDGYRTIGSEEGIVSRALKSYFEVIVTEGFLNNLVLNICLCVVAIILWHEMKAQMSDKGKICGQICMWIIIAYTATTVINTVSGVQRLSILRYVEGAATFAFIIAWIVLIIVIPVTEIQRLKLLFILGSAGCMIAPLLVVTPIGSRCFFASYVMQIYFLLELLTLASVHIKKSLYRGGRYMIIVCGTAYLYLCYIYGMIFISDQNRITKAKADAEKGKEVIQVENLPYEKYVWSSRPETGSVWEERFKLFYDIDRNIKIETKESHYK